MQNFRHTSYRIDAHETLPGGRVRVRGYLTRAGTFAYTRGNDKIRELRPEEEVFHADSLATLEGAYVTIDHSTNPKSDAVGRVLRVEPDPPYVKGEIQIEDERAVKMIQNGHLKEISCGYFMKLQESELDSADFIQTNIRYDHAALGPEGWGRLGSDVALRLDSRGNEVWYPRYSSLRRAIGLPDEVPRSLRERITGR